MILGLVAFAAGRTIYSIYDPIGDKLCVNYHMMDRKSETEQEKISVFTPGFRDYDGAKVNIFQCDTFHWGLGTNNSNPLVLEDGNLLKFWVDDATTFTSPPNGEPPESSKQLSQIIHASFLNPQISIVDRVTRSRCNVSEVVYNEKESVWETEVKCPQVNNYEIEISRISGWFIHGSNPPVSHSNVYPGVPSFFSKQGEPLRDLAFSDAKVIGNPCRPSLTLRLKDEDLYVSPTYFSGYYKTPYSNIKNIAFTDNSVVMYNGKRISVTNFLDTEQRYETDATISELRTPNVCSLSLSSNTYLGRSIIAGFTKGEKSFTIINLDDSPDTEVVTLPESESVVDIVTTISYTPEIFVLSKTTAGKFRIRKWGFSAGFTSTTEVTANEESTLHWSPFGFIFVTTGNELYHSHASVMHFIKMEFFSQANTGNFVKITENRQGEFLVTTDTGNIYYFSLDAPYLVLLATTCSPGDSIQVKHDNTFVIISGSTAMSIPLKSEFAASDAYKNTECPRNYVVNKGVNTQSIYLDRRDTVTYQASILSKDGHSFRIKGSDIIDIKSNTSTIPIVTLGSHTTDFSNVVLSKIDVTISAHTPGTGRVMIHTSAPGWACEIPSTVFDVVVGCSRHSELRVRNNNVRVTQASPYYVPILDIYKNDEFVEEYTGRFSVTADKKFIPDGSSIGAHEHIQLLEEGAYHFVFKMLDTNWSYCELETTGEATFVLPKYSWWIYPLIGIESCIIATLFCFLFTKLRKCCDRCV